MNEHASERETDKPHAPPWAGQGAGRILGFLAFFAIFFGILYLFNLYVLTRLFSMLGLRHGLFFIIFTVLSSLSFAAAMGFRNAKSCLATKGYYFAAATWLGFLIYFIFATVAYDVLGWFVDFNGPFATRALITGTICLVAISLVVPYFVILREIDIPAGKLGRDLRVVHMSDIHVGATHGPGSLGKLVRMANEAKPDLVLITGDLADSPMSAHEKPFDALDGLNAPTFFSLGNHEYYAGIEEVVGMLAKTKVRVLRNEVVLADGVQVVGLDYGGARELKETLARLPIDRSKYTILMYHSPEGLEEAQAAGVDLMLSGHTHGGQFFPFTVINRMIWRRYKGLHEHKGTYLYTSTGAGTWGPPMRLGTRSEIALIKMRGRM